jgi:peptide/nickel transport system ATP-binding protein
MTGTGEERPMGAGGGALLEVKDLAKHFPVRKGAFKRVVGTVKAVDGVSFSIAEGETLGLVGESGCGKTTTGRAIVRAMRPTAGEILFRVGGKTVDLATAEKAELKEARKHLQMIFQDPYASLNPRMTILEIVGEPLVIHGVARGIELERQVRDLLALVGLKPQVLRRYPHAFSGGQRQRIGIARALALHPRLVVADEPVSALDVSIQAQILNLLQDLQENLRLSYLFIAHDLSVVEHISDRVAVMYVGKLVETAETEELFAHPLHPYTEALFAAVPVPDPGRRTTRIVLPGEVADPAHRPPGCVFHPRCAYRQRLCEETVPDLREIGAGHFSSCHFAGNLSLKGAAI